MTPRAPVPTLDWEPVLGDAVAVAARAFSSISVEAGSLPSGLHVTRPCSRRRSSVRHAESQSVEYSVLSSSPAAIAHVATRDERGAAATSAGRRLVEGVRASVSVAW